MQAMVDCMMAGCGGVGGGGLLILLIHQSKCNVTTIKHAINLSQACGTCETQDTVYTQDTDCR